MLLDQKKLARFKKSMADEALTAEHRLLWTRFHLSTQHGVRVADVELDSMSRDIVQANEGLGMNLLEDVLRHRLTLTKTLESTKTWFQEMSVCAMNVDELETIIENNVRRLEYDIAT